MIQFLTTLFAFSNDCPALISLANGLGLSGSRYVGINTGDCCKSYDQVSTNGVACSFNRVIFVKWSYLLLNGTINSTALVLLDALSRLELQENSITSDIPLTFPDSLIFLNLAGNRLGSNSFQIFPPNLQFLHVERNSKISAELPPIPDSMSDLRLDSTRFTGSVYLKNPYKLNIPNAKISRVYVENSSLLFMNALYDKPGYCNISSTPVYRTQVEYLSGVCQMFNIIENSECEVVVDIANDLGMMIPNLNAYQTLLSDCCNGFGITCDENRHITDINWSNMELNGILNTAKIELLYSYLQSFNISNNFIRGNISKGFTSNVEILDLSHNYISGSLDGVRLKRLKSCNMRHNLIVNSQSLVVCQFANSEEGTQLSGPPTTSIVTYPVTESIINTSKLGIIRMGIHLFVNLLFAIQLTRYLTKRQLNKKKHRQIGTSY